MNDVYLGIDVGTTAVKVAAFTDRGALLAEHSTAYPTARPHPGWAEQDPTDWWTACVSGIDAVTAGRRHGDDVRAIGVVSQVNTHLFTDSSLTPLAPAINWQDQRCHEMARRLDAHFSDEQRAEIWGGPFTIDASTLVSRAGWFASHHPGRWARTRWILSPKDYIVARLTGQVATDAISSIGLVDRAASGYLAGVLALVDGLADRLPPLRHHTCVAGPAGAAELPSVLGASVVVGTMDAFGNVFGCGVTRPGRGLVSCGTSVIVAGGSERTRPAAGVITFPELDGLFVHAGPTQAGGDALRWWARACDMSTHDVLAEAATSPPGASGIVFTPHLLGERAPLWDSTVRGAFLGLSVSTARSDLSRAVLEGVAMSARQVLTAVESACDRPIPSLSLCGGGARSTLWAQIFADVLGRPVARLQVLDSAVLGAAMLAMVGTGGYESIAAAAAESVRVGQTYEPDAAGAGALASLYRVYTDSYDALRAIHDQLDGWRRMHATDRPIRGPAV